MNIRVIPPQVYKLQMRLFPSGSILVYNRERSVQHEFDSDSVPHLVDYINDDPNTPGLKTYVWGFIEDNLLIVEHRVAPPSW